LPWQPSQTPATATHASNSILPESGEMVSLSSAALCDFSSWQTCAASAEPSVQVYKDLQLRTLACFWAFSRSWVSSVIRCVAQLNLRSVPATAAGGLRCRGGLISREPHRSSAQPGWLREC
jgi:hypothetical protein